MTILGSQVKKNLLGIEHVRQVFEHLQEEIWFVFCG